MQKFRAAAIQMRSGLDVAANVAAAEGLVHEAAAAGAQYVLTPEMTTILDRDRKRLLAAISPEAGDPSLKRFQELAAELGIHLHIGSMAIKLGEDAVAGVNGDGVGDLGGADDRRNIEIAFGRRSGPDAKGFVRKPHVQSIAVGFGMDGNGLDAHFLARPDDPNSDLAAIGDQNFLYLTHLVNLNRRDAESQR